MDCRIYSFPCIFPTKNIPVYNKIYRITKTNIRTPYSYNRKHCKKQRQWYYIKNSLLFISYKKNNKEQKNKLSNYHLSIF